MAPARVLLCHVQNEGFKFRINPRATASFSVFEGPLAFDQFAVPFQKSLWLEQEEAAVKAVAEPGCSLFHLEGERSKDEFLRF